MRAQAEEIPHVLGQEGVTVTMVCSPFPWLGVDLIKTEIQGLLALLRGRNTEGSEMIKNWLGGQAEAGERQKLASSPTL